MNKKTALTLIKLIPIVSVVLSFILIFSDVKAGPVAAVTVILAFFGFVFFFIGRKSAKEDKTLKILGILDLLSTVAIIAMYVAVFFILANSAGGDDGGGNEYAVEQMEIGSSIGRFESVDMDGNAVSDAIFAEKDVTVINVWATFCGPCIAEMPQLADMDEELPDNVQVVGIVMDASPAGAKSNSWRSNEDNIRDAKTICNEAGVKYTNILANESVSKAFENVEAVPTTFIVDKSGNIICKAFVGADVEGYNKVVEDYLDSNPE
jgi:thiol-disulfide isomerase/thioredoxin